MDYAQEILTALVDTYERRRYDQPPDGRRRRSITLDVNKQYPEYRDHLGTREREIDEAITRLAGWQMVSAPRSDQGYYAKLTLCLEQLPKIYTFLGRKPAQVIRQEQMQLLEKAQSCSGGLTKRFAERTIAALREGRSPGYGLQGDTEKLRDVLLALEKIEHLHKETYLRNFSEAVFHDSKRFQSISGSVRSALVDLTEQPMKKEEILEYYNLFENPTYLYLKGGWILGFPNSDIRVADLPGGIGLASDALSAVQMVRLQDKTVVSVENLTTYHDTLEHGRAVLYLGGFPNSVQTDFLRLVYANEPEAAFFHHGDLDPHGFLILENLKQETGIPFRPMGMDIFTLQECFAAGHYRSLTAEDRKVMQYPTLRPYSEIFEFMKEHNCKVEQESFAAMRL
jgi:hypothetical protein